RDGTLTIPAVGKPRHLAIPVREPNRLFQQVAEQHLVLSLNQLADEGDQRSDALRAVAARGQHDPRMAAWRGALRFPPQVLVQLLARPQTGLDDFDVGTRTEPAHPDELLGQVPNADRP